MLPLVVVRKAVRQRVSPLYALCWRCSSFIPSFIRFEGNTL